MVTDDVIDQAVLIDRRQNAEDHAEYDRKQGRHTAQIERNRQRAADDVADLLRAIGVRFAEITRGAHS